MNRTTQHRFTALAGVALLAGAASLGVAAPALAHDELVGTAIVTDEAGAAEAFTLSFSNSIIEVGTEIVATGPDGAGTDITDGDPTVAGPDVTQKLQADLEPGDYSVAWRVVSSDGHPIDGAFAIVVPADGEPTIEAAPAEDVAEAEGDGHEHADGEEDGHAHDETGSGSDSEGMPMGVVIAIATSAAVVVIGAVVAIVVGAQRRKQAMGLPADRTDDGTPTA